jgi:hypothetical protein
MSIINKTCYFSERRTESITQRGAFLLSSFETSKQRFSSICVAEYQISAALALVYSARSKKTKSLITSGIDAEFEYLRLCQRQPKAGHF